MRVIATAQLFRVTLATLLIEMAFTVLLHFPRFLTELGASELDIGLLYGTAAAVNIILRPWMGRTIDRYGRRQVVAVGGSISAMALLSFSTIDTFGAMIFVVTIVYMSGQVVAFTALYAHATDVVPAGGRTRGLALFSISFLLPLALGSILGERLLAVADFDVLFFGAVGFIAGAIAITATLADPGVEAVEPRRSFFTTLSQRDLRPLWLLSAMYGLGITSLYTWMRTYTDTSSVGSLGLFFGVFASTAIMVSFTSNSWPGEKDEKRILALGIVSFLAGFFLLAFAGTTTPFVVSAALLGVGQAFVVPIMVSAIADRSRPSERGSAMAIFVALFDVAALVGGPIMGATIQSAGYSTAFASVATTLAAGFGLFFWWDGPIRARSI